jgi:hypothetical protein
LNWLGLEPVSLVVTVLSVFVAGIIRGYSGFGFAMTGCGNFTDNSFDCRIASNDIYSSLTFDCTF